MGAVPAFQRQSRDVIRRDLLVEAVRVVITLVSATFLASDESRTVTAQSIPVDAGGYMQG
ncbi:hypothetical protein BMG05_17890 [Mycobacterium malmoense]|nr:hypothetical protein BMG05_17890 [Mycobacterium malmoense]